MTGVQAAACELYNVYTPPALLQKDMGSLFCQCLCSANAIQLNVLQAVWSICTMYIANLPCLWLCSVHYTADLPLKDP